MKKQNFSYDVIADLEEVKWFYDHILVKPVQGESLLICHSARRKGFTPEEIEKYQLGRSEMFHTEISKARANQEYKWEDFIGAIYKLECNKYGYTTKTYEPYPDKSLVSYIYLNPCSEAACVMDTVQTFMSMNFDALNAALKRSWGGVDDSVYKFSTIANHIKSCHAQNPSRKVWIDFDIDWDFAKSEIPVLHDITEKWFGKSNFVMVKTSGGIHIFVKKEALKFNPNDYMNDVKENVIHATAYDRSIGYKKGDKVYCSEKICVALKDSPTGEADWDVQGEVIKNDNTMCAIPGTYQYGKHIVRVINKEDFE